MKSTPENINEIELHIIANYKTRSLNDISVTLNISKYKVGRYYDDLVKRELVPPLGKKISVRLKNAKKHIDVYHNADGENKKLERSKIAKYVVDSGVSGTILTLPHIECKIERLILDETNKYDFIGVDKDFAIIQGAKRVKKQFNLPITFHHGLLSDKIYCAKENTYAHLIADYCGGISTCADEITYGVERNIVKVGGYLLITISKPIRGLDKKSRSILNLSDIISNQNDLRSDSDKAIDYFFQRLMATNRNYKIIEYYNYMDSYPMTLIVLKRIN